MTYHYKRAVDVPGRARLMADGEKVGAGGKPHHYITSERQRGVRIGIILTGNSVAPFHTISYEPNSRTFLFLAYLLCCSVLHFLHCVILFSVNPVASVSFKYL